MKINTNYPIYGNPNGINLYLVTPINDCNEPFCYSGPILIRSNVDEIVQTVIEHFKNEFQDFWNNPRKSDKINTEGPEIIEENLNIDFFGTVE